MTALKEYQRLEAAGQWSADAAARPREVIVSLGEATLTLSDMEETPLAHWSLPAVVRRNPGRMPALYAPGPDSDEVLEIEDELIIDALERLHAVIERRRGGHGGRRGRLRHLIGAGLLAVLAALAVFWLPGALVSYTAGVLPPAMRADLGARLLGRLETIAGPACTGAPSHKVLASLGRDVLGTPARLAVLADLPRPALALPGATFALDRRLIEEFDSPYPLAGALIAQDEAARQHDPVLALLRDAGLWATLRLLTSGRLPEAALERHAARLLTAPPPTADVPALLQRFRDENLPATPWARAQDPAAPTARALTKADPVPPDQARALLDDADWVILQGICND